MSSPSVSLPLSTANSLFYKRFGIIGVIISQTTMPLMVRASRDRDVAFIITVNVFCMDLIKLIFCAVLLSAKEWSFLKFLKAAKMTVFGDPIETAKVCFPSIIYLIQNNLYYIALSNLESTTFLVIYQLKILTTALLLHFFLKKTLSSAQWMALVILMIGVSIVQSQYDPPPPHTKTEQSPLVGFAAVTAMCFTSSFAGVYLELVLKQSQNIRMALFGIIISLALVWAKDRERIYKDGIFVGYDPMVWLMTVNNSLGGLLIAVVIKYADNIMKAYAQATAILGAAFGSWLIFNFVPNRLFAFGTALVALSVYLYNGYPSNRNQSVDSNSYRELPKFQSEDRKILDQNRK
uniref:UDP-galactose transporter n=1 Tax=Globodera pallida TaxID=36090 RepID=A0A183BL12_GLOPA